jgi:hypothetical protein
MLHNHPENGEGTIPNPLKRMENVREELLSLRGLALCAAEMRVDFGEKTGSGFRDIEAGATDYPRSRRVAKAGGGGAHGFGPGACASHRIRKAGCAALVARTPPPRDHPARGGGQENWRRRAGIKGER